MGPERRYQRVSQEVICFPACSFLSFLAESERAVGRSRAQFWEVFAPGTAPFYDLVALAWRVFDRLWGVESAHAQDFERIADLAAARVRTWLELGPQSLDQVRSTAEMEGIVMSG